MTKFIFIIVSMLCACVLHASMAERISANVRAISSVCVVMKQSKSMPMFDAPVESDVIIVATSDGKIRWEIKSPFASIMIFDGGKIVQYERVFDVWKRLETRSDSRIEALVRKISKTVLGDYSNYRVSETSDCVVLVPLDDFSRKFIKEIRVFPNSDCTELRRLEITDFNGDKTSLSVVSFVKNPENSAKAFTDIDYKIQ